MGASISNVFDYSIQHLAFEPPKCTYNEQQNINFVTTITGDRIATRCVGPSGRCFLRGGQKRGDTKFLLFSHGNADDIGSCQEYVHWLATTFNCNVLTYDYVNYGRSSKGFTSEKNMHAAITAVYEYVTAPEEAGGLEIPAECIVLVGKSLGSAPTVYLASAPFASDIHGVILMSPLASGIRALVPPTMACKKVLRVLDDMFCPSLTYVQQIQVPVFIIHGYEDTVINIVNARILAQKLPVDSLFSPLFVHAGHNDIEATHPLTMKEKIAEFLLFCDAKRALKGQSHLVDYLDEFE